MIRNTTRYIQWGHCLPLVASFLELHAFIPQLPQTCHLRCRKGSGHVRANCLQCTLAGQHTTLHCYVYNIIELIKTCRTCSLTNVSASLPIIDPHGGALCAASSSAATPASQCYYTSSTCSTKQRYIPCNIGLLALPVVIAVTGFHDSAYERRLSQWG